MTSPWPASARPGKTGCAGSHPVQVGERGGQGGFGAVMGDKKLKAIAIKPGTVRVPVADPNKSITEAVTASKEISPGDALKRPLTVKNRSLYGAPQSWPGLPARAAVAACLSTTTSCRRNTRVSAASRA